MGALMWCDPPTRGKRERARLIVPQLGALVLQLPQQAMDISSSAPRLCIRCRTHARRLECCLSPCAARPPQLVCDLPSALRSSMGPQACSPTDAQAWRVNHCQLRDMCFLRQCVCARRCAALPPPPPLRAPGLADQQSCIALPFLGRARHKGAECSPRALWLWRSQLSGCRRPGQGRLAAATQPPCRQLQALTWHQTAR